MAEAPDLYAGLMSGTSADGVDGVLVQWNGNEPPRVLAHVYEPFDSTLRAVLLQLNQSGADELARAAYAASALARRYAHVTQQLLARTGLSTTEVRALGAHGQTVRHRPGRPAGTMGHSAPQSPRTTTADSRADPAAAEPAQDPTVEPPVDPAGYTLQVLNGALLAELTGIDVVCDFRSRDVAAGGQGAPLVPAVHNALFARADADVAVLNLGGIANLSLLPALPRQQAGEPVLGFDTGPANALMDLWCERHGHGRFDAEGRWAARGHVNPDLLASLRQHPYFAQSAPKSTGRDTFDAAWLDRHLARAASHGAILPAQDVQATLAELTASTVAEALLQHSPDCSELLVCGGGALNGHLMHRLRAHLPAHMSMRRTDALGIPVDQVEALAFAWLARARLHRWPGNLPAVTGAAGLRVLGAVHAR